MEPKHPKHETESKKRKQARQHRVRLVTVRQCWTVSEAVPIRSPNEAHTYLRSYFEGKDREHFVALHLDSAHQPISVEVVSVGTLNSSLVHPREVFKGAILANAAGIIVAHNHPSGRIEPSMHDRVTFKKLAAAGELLGIPILDFLVVSGAGCRSLREES